jgi:hypothetical protein
VAGAGDGARCSVLSAFCYGSHLKSAPRMTALECHGARGYGHAGVTTACARTRLRISSGKKAMIKKVVDCKR